MNKPDFTTYTNDALVTAYAKECGNMGWGTARATYLAGLHMELEKRFDTSAIIQDGALCLKDKTVSLVGDKIQVAHG